MYDVLKRENVARIMPTPMRLDPTYVRVYILWMNLIVQIIIPFVVLIVLNSFIYKKIKAFEKRSRHGSSSRTNLKVFTPHISSKFPQSNNVPSTVNKNSLANPRHMLTHSVHLRRVRSLYHFSNLRDSTTKNETGVGHVQIQADTYQAQEFNNPTTKNKVQQKQQELTNNLSRITSSNSHNSNINPYINEKQKENEKHDMGEHCCKISDDVETCIGNEQDVEIYKSKEGRG